MLGGSVLLAPVTVGIELLPLVARPRPRPRPRAGEACLRGSGILFRAADRSGRPEAEVSGSGCVIESTCSDPSTLGWTRAGSGSASSMSSSESEASWYVAGPLEWRRLIVVEGREERRVGAGVALGSLVGVAMRVAADAAETDALTAFSRAANKRGGICSPRFKLSSLRKAARAAAAAVAAAVRRCPSV